MSRHPQEIRPVPAETRRVAQAALPRGNVYRRRGAALGARSDEHLVAPFFPAPGPPVPPPWRLALTTVMPCAQGLSERQAAAAVRRRLDWT
jgi:transposase